MKNYIKNEKGQTIIILLLVMVVGLTIGLSLVNRSLTDIKISQQTEQSQRAFSAAEAGLEYVLSQGLANIPLGSAGIPKTPITENVYYSGQVEKVGSVGYELSGKAAVEKDDVAQVNLDSADLEGRTLATSLDIYWGEYGTSQVPCGTPPVASLELTFVTKSGTTYGIQKYAYNACNIVANNFEYVPSLPAPTPGGSSTSYFTIKNVGIPLDSKILRIKPLYNNASIKIVPQGGQLPQQAYKLTVKGEAQGKVRAIEWQQPIKPALPAIFDYVLFSGSSTNPLSK